MHLQQRAERMFLQTRNGILQQAKNSTSLPICTCFTPGKIGVVSLKLSFWLVWAAFPQQIIPVLTALGSIRGVTFLHGWTTWTISSKYEIKTFFPSKQPCMLSSSVCSVFLFKSINTLYLVFIARKTNSTLSLVSTFCLQHQLLKMKYFACVLNSLLRFKCNA